MGYRRLGGIQQLQGQHFAIFYPPSLRGQFLYPKRGQKQTFLVHVVIECHLGGFVSPFAGFASILFNQAAP